MIMSLQKAIQTAALAAACLASQTQALAQTGPCPGAGPRSAASLAREWILVGWEKRPGDPPFNFDTQLGRFYDMQALPEEASFYDDFDPQHRLLSSAREYGAIWQVPFTSLR
jgi:hypothetical protein